MNLLKMGSIPAPCGAVELTDPERRRISAYVDQINMYDKACQTAKKSLDDVVRTIAERAGLNSENIQISADLGFIMEKK